MRLAQETTYAPLLDQVIAGKTVFLVNDKDKGTQHEEIALAL